MQRSFLWAMDNSFIVFNCDYSNDKIKMTAKTKQWFIDRIGKTIFTNKVKCKCNACEFIHENGLVIDNEFIATAIYDSYKDFRAEGDDFDYFDTKEERDKFEKIQNHELK